jgi:pimeloyl-ACP methyl ester carboxylesterase
MMNRRCGAFPTLGLIGLAALPGGASGHVNPWPTPAKYPSAPATLHVGSLTLVACSNLAAYCGRLERPLDPDGAIPDRISIYFEFYPHTVPGKSAGTLVATEGGPGYPAALSRDDYLALFKPLRDSRDFVLMDNRGTGKSGALDCQELQTAEKWTEKNVAGCGERLGARAPLYSTAYAADDLAAILAALNAGPIDLYGDSYGTFFEQVFAIRHPDAVRSIVLDGAYPMDGPDYAWFPSYAPATRTKFNIACRHSEACAKLPGSSLDHIAPLLTQLRAAPFVAHAADSNGKELTFTANASQLATVMFAGAPALATVRELDAAARAFLEGDRAPLLRLMAETISAVDSRDPSADPAKWSAGLAAAVMCQDQRQIFDMRLGPALRGADRDRAIALRQRTFPDTYAPFTIDEFRAMPLDYSFLDQCVGWPAPPANHPAAAVVARDAKYPAIPALIISGELDDMTTLADGEAVAQAFKRGQQIRIANSFHVNALPRARSPCAAVLVRRFIETLNPGDTGCALQVPPVRLVRRFAILTSDIDPAAPLGGNLCNPSQLRLAAAAVLTVGDILARLSDNSTGRGVGLRGGSFRIREDAAVVHVSLSEVRWTQDLPISGRIDRARGSQGVVRAVVHFSQAGGGQLSIRWAEGASPALARIDGRIGGSKVVAQVSAP